MVAYSLLSDVGRHRKHGCLSTVCICQAQVRGCGQ